MLRRNSTLRELNFNDNKFTLNGFRAIESGLYENKTLGFMIFPLTDFEKNISLLSSLPHKGLLKNYLFIK